MANKNLFFNNLQLLKNNITTFRQKYKYEEMKDLIKGEEIREFKERQLKGEEDKTITIQEKYHPANTLGAVSERAYKMAKGMKMGHEF